MKYLVTLRKHITETAVYEVEASSGDEIIVMDVVDFDMCPLDTSFRR